MHKVRKTDFLTPFLHLNMIVIHSKPQQSMTWNDFFPVHEHAIFHFLHNIMATTMEYSTTQRISCDIVLHIWLHSRHTWEEKCFISPHMSACKIVRSAIAACWCCCCCLVWKMIENRSLIIVDLWIFF